MERVIAGVLLWGGILSALIVVCGLAAYVAHGGWHAHALALQRTIRAGSSARPSGVFVSLRALFGALRARDPLAVIGLGLVALLVTPVVGVAVAIPAFLRAGDRRYALIALIVLSMLVLSLFLGGGVV